MSYYVHRIHEGDDREGWVGPIWSLKQAEKEAAAWMSATDSFGLSWTATVHEKTREVQREVNRWVASRKRSPYDPFVRHNTSWRPTDV